MTASWKNVPAGVNSLGIPATDDFGSSGLWLGDSYPKYTTFQHINLTSWNVNDAWNWRSWGSDWKYRGMQ
jgi:hypothetical protein